MFWALLGCLHADNSSTSAVQKMSEKLHLRVNRQLCIRQGELLSQPVLPAQIALYDPLQGPRNLVHQYQASLEQNDKYCICDERIYCNYTGCVL